MVEKLRASLLRPNELTVVAQRLSALALTALPNESSIQKIATVIGIEIDNLERTLLRERTSEFTALLAERDKTRENAFIALRDYVKASTNRPDPQIAAAGELIYGILQRRGLTLYRYGYTKQSAELNLLLEDLSTADAEAAVDVIGGAAWLTDLSSANEAFERTYSEKVASESQQDFPPLAEARAKLVSSVETLLSCIEILQKHATALGVDDETELLATLTNMSSGIITDFVSVARARKTRESNASSSGRETTPAETDNVPSEGDELIGEPANEPTIGQSIDLLIQDVTTQTKVNVPTTSA